MKRSLFLLVLVVLAGSLSAVAAVTFGGSYRPRNGFVPDTHTEIRVAEAVLVPIYGEKQVASERPFSAELKGNIWTVTGHLAKGWHGGVAGIRISKQTCEVVSVTHGK